MRHAVIIDAVRTPRGRAKATGALRGVHPHRLLGIPLAELIARTGVAPRDIDDVVVGCVSQFGDQGSNLAMLTVLALGWEPKATTGVTLNRFCGSGQQAVNFAAMGVMSGMQDAVLAGGVESISRVPLGSDKGGLNGHDPVLSALHPLVPQGIAADVIAATEGFTRLDLDHFSLSSQQRAAVAIAEDRFKGSLVPVLDAEGQVVLDHEEHPRPETTIDGLAALEPSFASTLHVRSRADGESFGEKVARRYPDLQLVPLHTAGSSSGLVDGAGAVLVTSEEFAAQHDLQPRARIVSMATASDDPVMMLTAPGPASLKCLVRGGMTLDDIDLFEVNEAFAAIPLKFMKDLALDPAKVNVNGGAIALGHPFGATGAMLFSAVLDELERTDQSTGLITMCIGTGQATATIVERI